jgi:general L-amino acid transport system permease protein
VRAPAGPPPPPAPGRRGRPAPPAARGPPRPPAGGPPPGGAPRRRLADRLPAFLRDVRVLRVLFQVGLLAAVVAFLGYLYSNLQANTRPQDRSFNFLNQAFELDIPYSDFNPRDSVRDALVVGVQNTLVVSLTGIVLILLLGTLVGVARLSGNWLVRKAAGVYVETFRNLPPLICILLVMAVSRESFPAVDEAVQIGNLAVFSNQQHALVSVADTGNAGSFVLVLLLAVGAGFLVRAARSRQEDRTGTPAYGTIWGLATFAVLALAGWFALRGPLELSRPEVVRVGQFGRTIEGGIAMGAGFFAVLVGLVLYTATHVAEIVRGSIQAVPHGQSEAASSLGLSTGQRLRYVVLPQAFRIATPPTINQFLNLTKNTSLGLAVGYIEMTAITRQAVSRGNPAIPAFLVLMGLYLVISLSISLISNVVNRRLQLVER